MTQITVAEIAPTDTRAAGHWYPAKGTFTGLIDMRGATLAEARSELLEQCATDEERAGILAGSLVVLADSVSAV